MLTFRPGVFPLRWLAAAGLIWGAMVGPAAAGAPIAEVVRVQGAAEMQRRGVTGWVALRSGYLLERGDRVRTQQGQLVLRSLDGGKSVRLIPHTELEIVHPAHWRLVLGKVLVWLLGRRRLQISAYGTVAAVEGTAFLLEADAEGTVQVTVGQGQVRFFNDRGQVVVNPGQRSEARPEAAPIRPVPVEVGDIPLEPEVEALSLDAGPAVEPGSLLEQALQQMNGGDLEAAGATLAGLQAQLPGSAAAWACQALWELARGRLEAAWEPPEADLPGRAAWSLAYEARRTVRTFAGQFGEAEAAPWATWP